MKIAPIMHALAKQDRVQTLLVHTGQHYDEKMSQLFFDELNIPEPDINLEVGSCSHAVQTARVMERFEPICLKHQPDWVIVVGDVNSTLACALVAEKLGIKVAHVESGLRSFDRSMPEEINRIVTDSISDLLLVSEPSGIENLRREGMIGDKVRLVGNVMIDSLLRHRERANQSNILNTLKLNKGQYGVMTLHRPSNVDDRATLSAILDAVEKITAELPVVFPIHPRSKANLAKLGLADRVAKMKRLQLIEPLGYLDFLKLMSDSLLVMTDSGGIQEETTILQVPCLTLRENTERPITIYEGTNRLTGTDTEAILTAYRDIRAGAGVRKRMPDLWDGKAAERIVESLLEVDSAMREPVGRGELKSSAKRIEIRQPVG